MVEVSTAPWIHGVIDLAAWGAAGLAAWMQHRMNPDQTRTLIPMIAGPGYHRALVLGACIGAWLTGSLNSLPITLAPSHSLAGALAGGIVGVEIWKWRHGLRASTGRLFVLPLAVGIVVGRLGCLLSGLPDFTYGTPTTLPWAVDLGDGIGRHPVQVYESLAMALFVVAFLVASRRGAVWATTRAFPAFVFVYAAQRFGWEFLKPYPKIFGSFNLFQLLCVGLMGYGILWWRRALDADS